jgi:hypothetical protein
MKEAEWLACAEPQPLLQFLCGRASDRKLRLFACACVRRIARLLNQRAQQAVAVAEDFADGRVGPRELDRAAAAVEEAEIEAEPPPERRGCFSDGRYLAAYFCCRRITLLHKILIAVGDHIFPGDRDLVEPLRRRPDMVGVAACAAGCSVDPAMAFEPVTWSCAERVRRTEALHQAGLLRDIFHPFRPAAAVSPTWLRWNDATVMRLARAAYDERELPEGALDRTRLAVLADALEEAGCTDSDVLAHLREPGPHRRGCWALDLLLEKQ